MLFHITSQTDWERAVTQGRYQPQSLHDEGFIHLSTEAQWPRTAARFYRGRTDLVLLAIDPSALTSEVRYEPAHGDHFPHLFGDLLPAAVIAVTPLAPDADGVLQRADRETIPT